MADYALKDELAYMLHFLAIDYIQSVLLPSANIFVASKSKSFQRITLDELIVYLGIIYSMEIVKLPERDIYWADLMSH